MKDWQRAWDQGVKGCKVREWCREVSSVMLGLSFEAGQLTTGHGNLRTYLYKFRINENE